MFHSPKKFLHCFVFTKLSTKLGEVIEINQYRAVSAGMFIQKIAWNRSIV